MKAASVCNHPDCPNLQPCPQHAPKPWQDSSRRTRTTNGWQQQRNARKIIRAHAGICHICHQPGALETDHIIALAEGGADTPANMAPIHHDCHQRKTQDEARRARQRQ
jgi:5-methylcytosine-specific restriction enzyme A